MRSACEPELCTLAFVGRVDQVWRMKGRDSAWRPGNQPARPYFSYPSVRASPHQMAIAGRWTVVTDSVPIRLLFFRPTDVISSGIINASSVLGSTVTPNTPFTVHLILRSQPDRCWIYIHVEVSDPVLRSIARERALAAIG